MASVDVRYRSDADVVELDPAIWFTDQLPDLLDSNGGIAHDGAVRLGCRPLGFVVEGVAFTLSPVEGTIRSFRGTDGAAVVVPLDRLSFSDLIQDIRTPQALATAKDIDLPISEHFRFLKWWPVLRAVIDGRPVHVPGDIAFVDRSGDPLDLGRSFTLDDEDEEMSWFLAQAGFLHLAGWWPTKLMDEISADIDQSVGDYQRGDGRSWWARTDAGEDRCVRLQYFQSKSQAVCDLLNDDRHHRIAALPGDGHRARWDGDGDMNAIEALVKPLGVVDGISDLPWHKDCSLGRHSYDCSGITTGISVTGADESSGQLAVVAGSHRANLQPNFIHPYLDLPQIPLPTETGDVTVHLSCTLHMSHPPITSERRVLYTGFALPHEGIRVGRDRIDRTREEAYVKVSQAPAPRRTRLEKSLSE
ncbi:MAG: phytanoyl-CoA dioxygenase family protein [Actinomycetota bacterium]|nr:phytanoyl-CoA dioxygenase family protein [Actinomycetota bacterium]